MKDVSIRAARLHQTRSLLCPEKASLYQEKSPRSWASGPAPGDSGRREALGVRARPASTGAGGGGRAPAPSGAAAPGPARAAVCGGARLRLPLTQAGRVVLRATPERIRSPLEVPTVPGEPPSRPFQQAARRPGDRGRGAAGAGFGRTCLRQTQRDRPVSACGVSPVLAHVTSSRLQQPDTYAEAKLGGRPRGSLGHCGRVSYGASRRKATRTHRGLQLVGVADTPHFTSCGFPRSQHMTPAAEMRSH